MHSSEDTITTGLQGVVEVLANRRCGSHSRERLGTHVLGVGAGEAHPADTRHRANLGEQIVEQGSRPSRSIACQASTELKIASVAVYVLAEQGHLGDPLANKSPYLIDYVE